MVKLFGGRGAAAIIGLFMLAIGSSEAGAQTMPNVQSLVTPAVLTTTTPARPAQTVSVVLPASIDREAAWLYRAGWPLYALVNKYSAGAPLSQEANCVATAVYFEARGETVEGQLAVAKVIMNRAASGKYPASWCSVVTQPWQFSFVNPHTGQLPAVDTQSAAWATAQGVTRVALTNVVPSLSNDVLWYHANYVAPSWGRRLNMASRIGAHIFYRS
ncbi:MAG TPA: cell wall hydrolase [Sphingomicrobium sp.]